MNKLMQPQNNQFRCDGVPVVSDAVDQVALAELKSELPIVRQAMSLLAQKRDGQRMTRLRTITLAAGVNC